MLGVELTEMFVASELEDSSLSENPTLATSMGLFLQKVNVIRDYLCDTKEGRQFWPSSVSESIELLIKEVDKLYKFNF